MNQLLLDRQIRPIYEALDNGSNKSAIQSCNKLLKKYPSLDLVKALKALAIVRSNKIEESLPLCDEVLASKPTDLDTLGAMMHVLRALGRHRDLVTMFDEAFKKQPSYEELGVQDFFANVRTGNWKNGQQIATRLHKSFKQERYLYWSVLCTLLQASDPCTPPSMRPILHKLAHRMLSSLTPESTASPTPPSGALESTSSESPKPAADASSHASSSSVPAESDTTSKEVAKSNGDASAKESKIASAAKVVHTSPDRLHVALSVLRNVHMYEEAAALLNTAYGREVLRTNLVIDEVRRGLITDRGGQAVQDEAETAREKVLDGDRNWLEFLAILNAVFPAPVPVEAASPVSFDRHASVKDLFVTLADKDRRKDRAPLLGLLELEKRARERGVGVVEQNSEDSLLSLMKLFFDRFGDKACCFDDLKPYVDALSAENGELSAWTTHLDSQDHNASSLPTLQRSINVHKLRRYILSTEELSTSHEEERAMVYLRQYTGALALGKGMPDTELQPADDLVILAAQAMTALWKSSGEARWLYIAASVLEFASVRSKHSYIVRLHLVRIYRLLGCPTLALNHYIAMNVKQVQNDTLSHFLLARAATFSHAATGDLTMINACVDASQIYVTNSTETVEFVVKAFEQERYSQIPEFISFEDQLDNSLERDLVKMEHVRMRLPHEVLSQELIDTELVELKFIFDRLHHDNRDFGVVPNYQPRGQASFNELTLMLDSSPGSGWLFTFLRIYIRVLQMASDLYDTVEDQLLIGDRPKVVETPEHKLPLRDRLSTRKEEELTELSPEERSLYEYSMALCKWLTPYHDHSRPPPAQVLAEATKQTELMRSGKGGKVSNGAANGSTSHSPPMNGHGQKRAAEEPPAVKEAPEIVARFFDDMESRFNEVCENRDLYCKALHIATITEEAAMLFVLSTIRFKAPAVVKSNKLGALTLSFKAIRTRSASILKDMSARLIQVGAEEATSERRKVIGSLCKPIQEIPEFEHDFVLGVAKDVTDARKRVLEGVGKGIGKVVTHLSS